MRFQHGSWRVFLPAVLLFGLAIVPPLVSLSLFLTGVIRDPADIRFQQYWLYLVTLPCGMVGTLALIGGIIAFLRWKSN